jgi:putative transposase
MRTPSPSAWVRTVRSACLDQGLIFGRRHLEHILRVYRRHYNEHRPHRPLGLLPPNGRDPPPSSEPIGLSRRDSPGGLIHEYEAA